MNSLKKILTTGAIITAVGLNGCDRSQIKYLEGTVKEELGTAQKLSDSNNEKIGNKSIKSAKPTYGLIITTDNGEYIIEVKDDYTIPITSLSNTIEIGDRVRIPYDLFEKKGESKNIGITNSSNIELIQKGKK